VSVAAVARCVAQTPRLRLRELAEADAAFALALLNDPDFLAHIGDKGVRTLDDAVGYLRSGPLASYAAYGHGLWAVESLADGALLGMSGLLRRDWLDAPDLGYAFLPAARGKGIASEAARAVLDVAKARFALPRVVAIVSPANAASIRLLEGVGFVAAGSVVPPGESAPIAHYAWTA
jgi:RimJ/RimL family protein N-acetyltransferase